MVERLKILINTWILLIKTFKERFFRYWESKVILLSNKNLMIYTQIFIKYETYLNLRNHCENTVKDEYDIGMYSRLRSFCSLYGWRPRNSGYTAEFQLWSMSVPHPRLPSHLHLQSPPDQNPVENELPKLEIGLAKLELSI